MYVAIDVGSNTVRMLIGQINQGRLFPVRYERAITRLGGDLDLTTGLAEESMQRTLVALKSFSEILQEKSPLAIRTVGTAALRRASNGDDFVNKVAEQTNLNLEIIDGHQEAVLCSLGVLEALSPRPKNSLIIDIGGGSTELVLLEDCQILFRESYPLGVVRLCEETADGSERNAVINDVMEQLKNSLIQRGLLAKVQSSDCEFIGTAGTATTLAALEQRMESYDWSKINNHILSLATLEKQQTDLSTLTVSQREELPGLEAGRGDLIIPGIQILLSLTKGFSRPHIRVSDFGLLEGVLLDHSNSSSD